MKLIEQGLSLIFLSAVLFFNLFLHQSEFHSASMIILFIFLVTRIVVEKYIIKNKLNLRYLQIYALFGFICYFIRGEIAIFIYILCFIAILFV